MYVKEKKEYTKALALKKKHTLAITKVNKEASRLRKHEIRTSPDTITKKRQARDERSQKREEIRLSKIKPQKIVAPTDVSVPTTPLVNNEI